MANFLFTPPLMALRVSIGIGMIMWSFSWALIGQQPSFLQLLDEGDIIFVTSEEEPTKAYSIINLSSQFPNNSVMIWWVSQQLLKMNGLKKEYHCIFP